MSASGAAKGLCVRTSYTSVEELVRALHPFAEDTTLFVASPLEREPGVESRFAILLADRTPAIQGWCIVVDSWADAGTSPYQARGLRIGLFGLTPESERVLALVRDARAPKPSPEPPQTKRRVATIRIPAILPTSGKRTLPAPVILERTAPADVPVCVIPPRTTTGPLPPPPMCAEGSQPMTMPPRREPEPAPTPAPTAPTAPAAPTAPPASIDGLDDSWDMAEPTPRRV